jgi:predicted ATPase
MIHLNALSLPRIPTQYSDTFPFSIPAVKTLSELEFSTPVTFFVGENGSGKSTVLEAIAAAAGSITAGSDGVEQDSTLASVRRLAGALKLSWTKRTRKGFFLRAEDYFGYVKRMAKIREGLEQDLGEIDTEFEGKSEYARSLARMPLLKELYAMKEQYGKDLDSYSHGESFYTFFRARFVPDGLYLLDEPEAPLSPLRQLGFLTMLKEMVAHNAQFIIATHSPILLAYPGATIYSFDVLPVSAVAYDSLEHVRITRDFLNNPGAFLQHL